MIGASTGAGRPVAGNRPGNNPSTLRVLLVEDHAVTAETMAATREPTAQAMTAPLDNAGSFVLGGLPPGPVRLHLRAAGGGSVMTSWVSI